jgi:dipeptide/tripeptide permease
MLMVFANIRFMTFLLIFSGFWIMFWQIFLLLPFYTLEVLHFEKFEILETIDAWCIIALTIPVTMATKKLKPVAAITIGLSLASISWIIVGAGGTLTFTIVGIAVYALGEATQSPRFYEYVASLAPPDQTGTFMGFAFLPVAIGAFAGGPVADALRGAFMATNPSMMWFVVSAIGITSTLLMILYTVLVAPGNKSRSAEKVS